MFKNKKVSIKLFYVNIVLFSVACCLVHPVTPAFIQSLNLHDYMFGLILAFSSCANFLFSPLLGKLTAKYGASTMLIVCYVGYAFTQIFFGLSTLEWQVCLARFFCGFFLAGQGIAQMYYIIKNSENPNKDLAMISTLAVILTQLGFLIGGFIGEVKIFYTFVTQAAVCIFLAVYTIFFIGDSEPEKVNFSAKDINPFSVFYECKDILTKYIIWFLVLGTLYNFAMTCYDSCLNYYLRDVFNFATSSSGIYKAINGFVSFGLNYYVATKIIGKSDSRKNIISFFILFVFFIVTLLFVEDIRLFLGLNIVAMGVNSLIGIFNQDLITYHKTNKQAQFIGLVNSVRSLGGMFGSLCAGFVYGFGPKLSFVISAFVFCLCIGCSVVHHKLGLQEDAKSV